MFNIELVRKALTIVGNFVGTVNPYPRDRWVNVTDDADLNLWSDCNGVRGASLYQVNGKGVVLTTTFLPIIKVKMVCPEHKDALQHGSHMYCGLCYKQMQAQPIPEEVTHD